MVIVKVARWKAVAEGLQTTENLEKIEAMDAELQRLMVGIGATLKGGALSSKAKTSEYNNSLFQFYLTMLFICHSGMCKTKNTALQQLASEENVADVIALYMEFFNTPPTADSVDLTNQQPLPGLESMLTEGDPGIEIEASLSPHELSRRLGFNNGLPITFNTHRHQGGLSAWDHPGMFHADVVNQNAEMEAIVLHWHQLAGVHAIVRMLFTDNPTSTTGEEARGGVLIADEVGLGKTFQAATTVAFLSDLRMRQHLRQNQPDLAPNPPIIGKCFFPSMPLVAADQPYYRSEASPYLGADNTLPNSPHLIVVPGTLLSQWEAELKTLFNPKYFKVLLYGTGKSVHDSFWSEDGPFHNTKKEVSANVVILASHSVSIHFDVHPLSQLT